MPANYGTNTILSKTIIFNDSGYYAQILKEKYNDFPHHEGRPGQVGGSLPKGQSAKDFYKSKKKVIGTVDYKGNKLDVYYKLSKDELEKKLNKTPTTIIKSSTIEKNKSKLQALKGVILKNNDTEINAQINTTQYNKMTNNEAQQRSINNGFTKEDHFNALGQMQELFKNAILVLEREDKNEEIISIRRFIAPIKIDVKTQEGIKRKNAFVKLTVKEIIDKKKVGNRLYAAELNYLTDLEEKEMTNEKPFYYAPSFI